MAKIMKAAKEKKERYEKREKLFAFIGGAVMLLFSVFIFVAVTVIVPAAKYNKAEKCFKNGNNYEARLILKNLEMSDFGNYKDSKYYRESITNITVPDSIKEIKSNLFSDCPELTEVKFSNSVERIGEKAFSNCKNLQRIIIPASVKYIGKSAFKGCTSVSELVILGNPELIEEDAFAGCPITEAQIPMSAIDKFPKNKLKTIIFNSGDTLEKDVLSECAKLTSITIMDNVDNPYYKTKGGNLYSKDGKTLIQYALGKKGKFVISEGVTSIGDYAFRYCESITGITIPVSVTNIGKEVFVECADLEEVIYNGTKEEWNAINKKDDLFEDTLVERVVCTDGDIAID